MAGREFNSASRILGVIDTQIRKGTKSGANIDVTYGQVYSIGDGFASIYLAGSRELAAITGEVATPSEYFRIPTILDISASDYVRVSMDIRGHRWIDEVLGPTKINALSISADSVDTPSLSLNSRTAWIPARLEGFVADNPAASETDTVFARFGIATPYINRPIAGRDGRIVALAWRKTAAITAGQIDIRVTIAGGASSSLLILNSGSANSGVVVLGSPASFTSLQSIGLNYTTDASYAPVTLDYAVDLIIEYEPLA